MPFTPFHFGPAALVHAVAPRHVSFFAFCAANVVIDVEPLVFMLRGEAPLHRFAHSYVGAALVAVVTVALWLAARRAAAALRLPDALGWTRLATRTVAIGALVGSVSHVVLDSIMHADIRPLAPFSDANPLLRVVSLGTLHAACVAAGVLGIAIVGLGRLRAGDRAS